MSQVGTSTYPIVRGNCSPISGSDHGGRLPVIFEGGYHSYSKGVTDHIQREFLIVCDPVQVPQFLFEAGYGSPRFPERAGLIGVTQPRRVAAVSTARRVAEELDTPLGAAVGYQVRTGGQQGRGGWHSSDLLKGMPAPWQRGRPPTRTRRQLSSCPGSALRGSSRKGFALEAL